MTQVSLGENEELEFDTPSIQASEVSKAGIFADVKRLRHFETPIEKRKRRQ